MSVSEPGRFTDRLRRSCASRQRCLHENLLVEINCSPIAQSYSGSKEHTHRVMQPSLEDCQGVCSNNTHTHTRDGRMYALPTRWMPYHPIGSDVDMTILETISLHRPSYTEKGTSSSLTECRNTTAIDRRLGTANHQVQGRFAGADALSFLLQIKPFASN